MAFRKKWNLKFCEQKKMKFCKQCRNLYFSSNRNEKNKIEKFNRELKIFLNKRNNF